MGNGSFRGKVGRSVVLATYPFLLSRLRMSLNYTFASPFLLHRNVMAWPVCITCTTRYFISSGTAAQRVLRPPYSRGFYITQRRPTVGRTPLDEWSARRRDLYLTTHNTQQETDIHAFGGIRTHNFSRRAAADMRLRPRKQLGPAYNGVFPPNIRLILSNVLNGDIFWTSSKVLICGNKGLKKIYFSTALDNGINSIKIQKLFLNQTGWSSFWMLGFANNI